MVCSGGNVELRERIFDLVELDVAALRDIPRAGERIRDIAEELLHFGERLHVELLGREPHPVRVGHGLARLDAEHDLVHPGVVVTQIVRVVGRDQRDAGFARQACRRAA